MAQPSITITNKEVQLLLNCGETAAKNHLSKIRSALVRSRSQKVFLWEFCKFENIDIDYAKSVLKVS